MTCKDEPHKSVPTGYNDEDEEAINEDQTSTRWMVIFSPHSCRRGKVGWEKSKDTCKPYHTQFILRCLPAFPFRFFLKKRCAIVEGLYQNKSQWRGDYSQHGIVAHSAHQQDFLSGLSTPDFFESCVNVIRCFHAPRVNLERARCDSHSA